MTFTDYLLLESDKSVAARILKQAEDKVADEGADSESYHDEDVFKAAKKLAKGNKDEKAIIEIIKMKLHLGRK